MTKEARVDNCKSVEKRGEITTLGFDGGGEGGGAKR